MGGQHPDVVIVGAGSAGCVLAARLSEDSRRRVLLLEAGPDYPGELPAEIASALRPTYLHEWGYVGEPGRIGRGFKLPRAKVVGGCSATNAAIALRGLPEDYDAWAALGNPGWSWNEVLPVFCGLERDLDFSSPWHGTSGPMPVRRYPEAEQSTAARAFLASCTAVGFVAAPDLNAPEALGFGALPTNALGGVRQSAALTHLAAARGRANLEIRANVLVDRVRFEGERAIGVRLASPAQDLHAGRVILAAGAYGSPAILLRSGVGAAAPLRELGIPVAAERPGVGEGLMDHPLFGLTFAAPAEHPAPVALFQVALLARSAGATQPVDLQVMPRAVLPATPQASPTGATVMLFVALVEPRSRGRLALRSSSPADSPLIDLGYFTHEDDLPRLIQGVRLARRLAQAPPFAELAAAELYPGAADDTDDDLGRAILGRIETYHHPVGTCRMGPGADPLAVVDAHGAVHGLMGLAVVDASILPVLPAANTNLPTMMVAEKLAAELRTTT